MSKLKLVELELVIRVFILHDMKREIIGNPTYETLYFTGISIQRNIRKSLICITSHVLFIGIGKPL